MDKYKIAENICRLSKELGLSVEQLATLIGKSTRQVNRYRNGQCDTIPADVLNALAEALHADVIALLS